MKVCDRCKEAPASIKSGSEDLCAECWLVFNKRKKRKPANASV